jgi:hypothetical protein
MNLHGPQKMQEGLALGAKENEELKLVKTKVQMGTIRSQANNMINMKGSIAATLATRRSNAVPTSVTYAMQVKAMVDYAQQMLQSPYFLVEPGARAVIATNIDEIHRNVYPRIDALYIAAVRSGKKKLEGDLLDTLILLESAGNNIFRQCRAVETKIEETGHRLKKDMEKMREENKKPSALPWVNIGIAATISVLAIALRQPSLINFLLLAPLLYACYRLHEGGHQLENLWKGKTTKIVTTNLEWWNSGRTVPFASGKSGIIASAAGAVLFIVLALALPDFSRLLTVAVLINVAFLFSGADWDEMLQRRVIKQSIISAETHVSTATLFDKSRDISNEFSRLNPRAWASIKQRLAVSMRSTFFIGHLYSLNFLDGPVRDEAIARALGSVDTLLSQGVPINACIRFVYDFISTTHKRKPRSMMPVQRVRSR